MARDWQKISDKISSFVKGLIPGKRGRRAQLTYSSITQDVLKYLLERDAEGMSEQAVTSLGYTRARGAVIDRARREKRKQQLASGSSSFQPDKKNRTVLSSVASRERRPRDVAEATKAIESLAAPLTQDERTIFLLRAINDAPWSEIAAQLGITEANARMRFTRLKRRLLQTHLEPLRRELTGQEWMILELRGIHNRPWPKIHPLLDLELSDAQARYATRLRPRAAEMLGPLLGEMLAIT